MDTQRSIALLAGAVGKRGADLHPLHDGERAAHDRVKAGAGRGASAGSRSGAGTAEGLLVARLRSPLAGPFDLEAPRGGVVSISGASGSGKSLFLRMIADMDPHEGDVVLNGRPRSTVAAPEWRRLAPYVAADAGWWCDEVMAHFAPDAREEARALAGRLGVGPAQLDGPVGRLSTGERQRLALVRALVLRPPALLLDEPTGPLDPASVGKVEDVLRERAREGAIIVLASHDPQQGARLGAERYRMVERRLEREP